MEEWAFTGEQLSRFDGKDGRRVYVGYASGVYDVTDSIMWEGGGHQGEHTAGRDLTAEMDSAPHFPDELDRFPVVGRLVDKGGLSEVRLAGFEPAAFGFVDQRSIQLSYRRTLAEKEGFEPSIGASTPTLA
jgi:predicted heme/steroid binding protein